VFSGDLGAAVSYQSHLLVDVVSATLPSSSLFHHRGRPLQRRASA